MLTKIKYLYGESKITRIETLYNKAFICRKRIYMENPR